MKQKSMDEVTHKKNFNPINIRDLFMAKNPKAGLWVPGFIYRFLSRLLRIDFMNDPILYKHRKKHFVITFDKRFTPVQGAEQVKDYTYSLIENQEAVFSDITNQVIPCK